MTRTTAAHPCEALTADLLGGWRMLHEAQLKRSGQTNHAEEEHPTVRAYLLLRAWSDNRLAEALAQWDSSVSRRRRPVMAKRFEDREDEAPCIVPLPDSLDPWHAADSLVGEAVRAACADWFALAWQQSWQRTTRQDLGAVLFSTRSAEALASHCQRLMHQRSPVDGTERLLQCHDARIFQALWRTLPPDAHAAWLGPHLAWWSLAQPQGPWHPDDYASDAAPLADARWFKAEIPPPAEPPLPRALTLDVQQWEAAHLVGMASRIWAGYAHHRIPTDRQPDEAAMFRLLHEARKLGLSGTNAQDYVYATWLHRATDGQPRERSWQSPRNSECLRRALAQLRLEPDARLGSLLAEAASAA